MEERKRGRLRKARMAMTEDQLQAVEGESRERREPKMNTEGERHSHGGKTGGKSER